ncbi:MAG: peptidylprolyl isomerase [Burkholderiales bacterium]|nr:peptidylprolyl isomerase [Burkholderiales bacterium]
MKVLKEPLLHFLILGALLFAAYAWLNRGADLAQDGAARTVRITAAEVEWLKQTWARRWHRPPSEHELRGIVSDYLRETLLAREARALGLDDNDLVVRRRLAQKMEFLVRDAVALAEPREDALRRVYADHRDRFRSPAQISFVHVYFNRDRRGARTEADAEAALEALSKPGASGADMGDRFLLEQEFVDADEQAVARVLGREFARRVFALAPGSWQGPIESGYGLHLVRVTGKRPQQSLAFEAVTDELREIWLRQQEEAARERYFATLLAKYDVVVDESVRALVGPLVAAKDPPQ